MKIIWYIQYTTRQIVKHNLRKINKKKKIDINEKKQKDVVSEVLKIETFIKEHNSDENNDWLLEKDLLSLLSSFDDNHDSDSNDKSKNERKSMHRKMENSTSIKSSHRKKSRQRRSRRSKTTKPPTPKPVQALPMQTRRNAEFLFDSIAPHLEFDDIRTIQLKLKENT